MAVTSRDIGQAARWPLNWRSHIRLPSDHLHLAAYITTALLALVALYILLGYFITWGRIMLDDLRYGIPRTSHLIADVGHGQAPGMPSHLIAMNLDRQVLVLDIPGGDVDQLRVLRGPYLFGGGEDLTPVTMRLNDMNGDSHVDLVVRVKDEEIVYLNRDGNFVLATPQERQYIIQRAQGQ